VPYVQAPMSFILALDQGHDEFARESWFDQAGAICASAQKEFPQLFPQARLGGARPARNLVQPSSKSPGPPWPVPD